jgi:single-stranded DNA-binding protein
MSLYLLATGTLIADPQRREGAKGAFATATIRAVNGDEATFISLISFGEEAARLLELAKDDAVAVSGRARLSTWTGRDGAEKHGISLVAEQIAATKPCRGTDAEAQRRSHGGRKRYSPVRSSAPPLSQDRVADLYAGGLIP